MLQLKVLAVNASTIPRNTRKPVLVTSSPEAQLIMHAVPSDETRKDWQFVLEASPL
jgi:hypothetical protein